MQKILTVACGLVLLSCCQGYAETRIALLAPKNAGVEKLVPLVELRLAQNKDIVLLEREKIEEIFREQELGALLTAEGTAKRVALGKLLKADLLIALQAVQEPQVQGDRDVKASVVEKPQPYVGVTICETKRGLRLCNQPVEATKSIETDADAVVRLAEKAIEKRRTPIDDIVAVPPFVNNTLAYEGDHLKAACAQLIEEMLLNRPGVLVVELAEAKAVAQELAIGGAAAVSRRLPLYLMGEYRLEGAGEKRRVSFKLTLLRGTSEVDSRRKEGPPEELSGLLRDAAGQMFTKTLGQAVEPPNPKTEAEQLAERARLFTRLGNWQDALNLTEAALLLKPDRADLHHDAVDLLSTLCMLERSRESSELHGRLRSDGPSNQLAKALLPANLYHAECFMSNSLIARKSTRLGVAANHFWSTLAGMPDRESYESYLNANRAEIESIRAACRRVLAAKAAAKVQDDALIILHLFLELPMPREPISSIPNPWRDEFLKEHIAEICAGRGKLLQDFSYLSDAHQCGSMLEIPAGVWFRLCQEPAYWDFLRQAEGMPSAEIRAYAQNLEQRNQRRQALDAETAKSIRRSPAPSPTPGPKADRPPIKDPEVLFHPLAVDGLKGAVSLWSPIGNDCDLILAGSRLLVMKEKGRISPLGLDVGMSRLDEWTNRLDVLQRKPTNIAWDGQYVWALNPGKDGPLSVIDPGQGRIGSLGPEGGLPESISCAVAALAPGKVCVAGYFGRLWCGVATFDPKTGVKLEVFHEAAEVAGPLINSQPGKIPSTKLAQPVFFLLTLASPGGDGRPAVQRVLLGRGASPLLIDPEKREVQAVSFSVPCTQQFIEQSDAIYWGDTSEGIDRTTKLYRLGFPSFQKELVNTRFPVGPCAVYQGRVHVINDRGEYLIADSLKGNFRVLRADVPVKNPYPRPRLVVGNHYGLLLLSGLSVYRVELRGSE